MSCALVLLASRRVGPAAAAGPRPACLWSAGAAKLAQFARESSSGANDRGKGEAPEWEPSEEEQIRRQTPLRLAVKVAIVSWISYKSYEYFLAKDDLMVSSSLTLLRSVHGEHRASGLYRLDKWHTTDGARRAVLNGGGLELLLQAASLSAEAGDPAAANVALRLTAEITRLDGAAKHLESLGGVARARGSCEAMRSTRAAGAEAEAARCWELVSELERACVMGGRARAH